MAEDGPKGENKDGSGGYKPPAEQHKLVEAIQSFERQYRCADKNRANHDQKTLLWARVAGFGVWFYSVLTLVIMGAAVYSAIQARNQVDIATQDFRMDQRPYILIEDIKGQTKVFTIGEKARWDIHYVNYGKSPSIKEATDAHVWVGKTAFAAMEDFFRNATIIKPQGMAEFINPPNAAAATTSANGFHFVTLYSAAAINADEMAFIKTNDGGVVMAGRDWYFDIFGEAHYTDFCRYTLLTGATSDCPIHNEIH